MCEEVTRVTVLAFNLRPFHTCIFETLVFGDIWHVTNRFFILMILMSTYDFNIALNIIICLTLFRLQRLHTCLPWNAFLCYCHICLRPIQKSGLVVLYEIQCRTKRFCFLTIWCFYDVVSLQILSNGECHEYTTFSTFTCSIMSMLFFLHNCLHWFHI